MDSWEGKGRVQKRKIPLWRKRGGRNGNFFQGRVPKKWIFPFCWGGGVFFYFHFLVPNGLEIIF